MVDLEETMSVIAPAMIGKRRLAKTNTPITIRMRTATPEISGTISYLYPRSSMRLPCKMQRNQGMRRTVAD